MKIFLKLLLPLFISLCANALEYNPNRHSTYSNNRYSSHTNNPKARSTRENKTKPIDLSFGFHPYGSIKAGIEYYKYTEPGAMSISGAMYNIDGVFGAKLNSLLKTDIEIYYSQDMGNNKYDGSISSSSTDEIIPIKLKSNDYYVGGVYRFGFIATDGLNDWASFYLGLGYRYLFNNTENPPGRRVAYGRDQSYLYMPVGVNAKFPITQNIKIKLDAELRTLLLGWNKTHFTDVGYDSDAHFTQKNGTGYKLSLGVEFFITKKQAILIEGFFDYWTIGESDRVEMTHLGTPAGVFLEPCNNTIASGVQIGYSF